MGINLKRWLCGAFCRRGDYRAPPILATPNPTALRVQAMIGPLRRGAGAEAWQDFRELVEREVEEVCRGSTTRQLISICDTYADYGGPVERRNALLISLLGNMEKVGQSFLLWRTGYHRPFDPPASIPPRKIALWDGMDTMHADIGDVTNNLFARLESVLAETPALEVIYRTIRDRLRVSPTLLGAMNRWHGHVFESHTSWRADARYDVFRASGAIPAWKNDH